MGFGTWEGPGTEAGGGQGKERPVYCRRMEGVNGLGKRERRLVGG